MPDQENLECPYCDDSSGWLEHDDEGNHHPHPCPVCEGTGVVSREQLAEWGLEPEPEPEQPTL